MNAEVKTVRRSQFLLHCFLPSLLLHRIRLV
jgi:hypothetical protein